MDVVPWTGLVAISRIALRESRNEFHPMECVHNNPTKPPPTFSCMVEEEEYTTREQNIFKEEMTHLDSIVHSVDMSASFFYNNGKSSVIVNRLL